MKNLRLINQPCRHHETELNTNFLSGYCLSQTLHLFEASLVEFVIDDSFPLD